MTELKEELKIRPDEGPVDYAERVEAVLERHRVETGERLTARGTMPGETPSEVLERLPVLKTADGIRSSERARHRALEDNGTNRQKENYVTSNASTATDDSSRRYRIKSQERDVEKAVSEFEAAKKRLYRGDGSQVFSDEEHSERLGKLAGTLREKAEAVTTEAQSDIEGYEREALALSYTDPTSLVPASDRGRLEASRPFVKEDCETLAAATLKYQPPYKARPLFRRCPEVYRAATPAGRAASSTLRAPALRFPSPDLLARQPVAVAIEAVGIARRRWDRAVDLIAVYVAAPGRHPTATGSGRRGARGSRS